MEINSISTNQNNLATESTRVSKPKINNKIEGAETAEIKQLDKNKIDAYKALAKSEEGNNKENLDKNQNNEKDVIKAIENANKRIHIYGRKLEFSIHEKTKEIMVKVINTEDDSIIREIPSEKVLDMVAKMWEFAGLLVDEKR